MDFSKEYRIALELASSLRYEEAGQKLKSILSEQPDNIDALILLGKVEYYQRLFSSSRRRFETAITYDSGNLAAYYSLQFFNERKKRLWTAAAWVVSIVLLLFIGVFLNISISNGFNQFEEKINEQIGNHLELETELLNRMLILSDNLDYYANDFKELKESTEAGIEDLGKRVGDLDLKREEQFAEIEDNQLEYYSTILKEIKDLKEIAGRLEDENFTDGND